MKNSQYYSLTVDEKKKLLKAIVNLYEETEGKNFKPSIVSTSKLSIRGKRKQKGREKI